MKDNCIYVKFKKGKYIFLVLYVDDILLASSENKEVSFLKFWYGRHGRSLLCSWNINS
jgi:CRISPR/Cas system-associated protein Cas5 (RAMP superfamily)